MIYENMCFDKLRISAWEIMESTAIANQEDREGIIKQMTCEVKFENVYESWKEFECQK